MWGKRKENKTKRGFCGRGSSGENEVFGVGQDLGGDGGPLVSGVLT